PIDVRSLAATHRDLAQLVTQGRFREDLYYRLKVVTLQVPPLRERPEDIPVLARHFLARFAQRFGVTPATVTPELLARLAAHPWPGNVRELENALESAVALSADGTLDLTSLPVASSTPIPANTGGSSPMGGASPMGGSSPIGGAGASGGAGGTAATGGAPAPDAGTTPPPPDGASPGDAPPAAGTGVPGEPVG